MKVSMVFVPADERENDLLKLLQSARPDIQTSNVIAGFTFDGDLAEAEKIVHATAKLNAVSSGIKRRYEEQKTKLANGEVG